MKRIFSTFILLLPFTLLYGQNTRIPVSRGAVNLAGGVSYSSATEENTNASIDIFNFNPQVYVFVMKYWALGGSITYQYYSYGKYSTSEFGFNTGTKLYFPYNKLYPYLMFAFGKKSTQWNDVSEAQDKTDTIYGAGLDVMISRNVALEPYFQYQISSEKYLDEGSINTRTTAFGIALALFLY